MTTSIQRFTLALGLSALALAAQAASLEEAVKALGADKVQSIELAGGGRWYQFGQAPSPSYPWPAFEVSQYKAQFHFDAPSARVQTTRTQTVEAGRLRPAPVQQNTDQYLSGKWAWNVGVAPANATPAPQVAAWEERTAEVWSTPQGFLKAALANKAESKFAGDGVDVSFTLGSKYRYVGKINDQNQLERVRTWIDNPVTGDTEVETTFAQYKDFGGVSFPAHIVRTQGGFRVLDIAVASVKVNGAEPIAVPEAVSAAKAPPVTVAVSKLADGVFYLTSGTHHSVAIEQKDHVVLVEAPLNEARSEALIAKVKETLPGKPIKYVVNTHAHFDHAGGLRTFVDEGSTIVTHRINVPYYKQVWGEPHSLNPDRLEKSHKAAVFEAFQDKHVLSDGQRSIELHVLAGNGHNDAFAFVYLPAEKVLIEADAYTPLAANAALPATVNPYAANLLENLDTLKLDVVQVAALHGPGVVKLADLKAYVAASKAVAAQ